MAATTQQNPANQFVLEERDGNIVTLRLNRPDRLNALNVELGRALVHALIRAGDDKGIAAIRIIGAGRGFCAGGDLELLRDLRKRKDSKELENLLVSGKEICLVIAGMPKPVIAAVNGPALGAGFVLTLCCDILLAADGAIFAMPEVDMGLAGGVKFLQRHLTPSKARRLLLTGQRIPAAELYRLGVLEECVPGDQLLATATAIAREISSKSPLAIQMLKQSFNTVETLTLRDGYRVEQEMAVKLGQSEDAREAKRAFLEKRKPVFTGR